jgi:predicted amidohydrolase
MNNIKIALLQLLPLNRTEDNLQKGIDYCKRAKEQGADIALFPEMWSNGYNIPKVGEGSVSIDSSFVTSFGNLAMELDMAIGITYLEKFNPMPRNTVTLFDRFGRNILTYSKVHTCDFDEECRLTPGDDFYVADLDIGGNSVKIGAMICYDREFPESARILMLKGAEIILVPNACPMEINRISQLRARAYENMVGIVTVNYPEGKPDCNGHSNAFDGIAYKPDEPVSRDTLIIEADENEGIFIAEMPIDEIRDYRSREVHGNAYRHPCKYKLIVSEEIEYPFLRNDYRK